MPDPKRPADALPPVEAVEAGSDMSADLGISSAQAAPQAARALARTGFAGFRDSAFFYLTMAFGLSVVVAIAWIGYSLFVQSQPAVHKFGWTIFRNMEWDVPNEKYGIVPFIYGTMFSSGIALLIAVPISIGSALFLTEIAPRWLAAPLAFMIEMLAAVPSVIFGLWGFLALCPLLNGPHSPGQYLADHFGTIPLFEGPPYLTNLLAAGVVLAIMVIPFITSVSRELIRAVPLALREASLGLGATRWETVSKVVLKSAQSGIFGAVILGLGRAIGETMAVIMVIGNTVQLPKSLLQPAYTMPGLLALQFKEAQNEPIQRAVLLEIAFALFIITLIVNGAARLLILLTAQGSAETGGKIGQRIHTAIGGSIRVAAVTTILFFVARQVYADFALHGVRGLVGPVEGLAVLVLIVRGAAAVARGSSAWGLWRKVVHGTMLAVVGLSAFVGCAALAWLLLFVARQGLHAIHPSFFTQPPKSPDDPTGGMLNGIVGTLILVLIAGGVGLPVGLMGGIYLGEFRTSRLVPYVRFAADVLNGVPSVVMGMFGYALFVLPFHHFSAWAGGATLGIMMIPTIVRTTEEMLRLVPATLREASLSLGATRLGTIFRIVLPAASGGIVTGVMLAIARIAGETAPLLFTAFGNDMVELKPSQPVSSMTMEIYNNYTYGGPAEARAWAGALVLLLFVLIVSVLARLATRRKFALK
jgi:phosphate transport system permease protein